MTRQLLIYDRATPVSQTRHGNWSVAATGVFTFARGINSVPLMVTEITAAARDYCIVFAGQGEAIMPAVVLGVREGENAYLDDGDRWRASYVPAFLRRYPFVFASDDQGKTFTLCIDEHYAGCNTDGRGQPLFDATGGETDYLRKVVEFSKQYQVEFQRTKILCERLKSLDLFESTQAQIKLPDGRQFNLGGFYAVGRERLKALPAETLAELAKSDLLELIYVHLQSMRNFSHLGQLSESGGEPSALHGPAAGTA